MLQFLKNRFYHYPNNPKNLNLQLHLNLLQFKQPHIQQSPQSHSFINIAISPTIIRRILQSLPNSVYPTIIILNHNLITYTILCTIYLQLGGKTLSTWPNIHLNTLIINQNEDPESTYTLKAKRTKKPPQQ